MVHLKNHTFFRISLLLHLAPIWVLIELIMSSFEMWYWKNEGWFGLDIKWLILAGMSLLFSIYFRILAAKTVFLFSDYPFWILLAFSIGIESKVLFYVSTVGLLASVVGFIGLSYLGNLGSKLMEGSQHPRTTE